jgi:hypothetical protein
MTNQLSKILVVCNKDTTLLSGDRQKIIVALALQRLRGVHPVVLQCSLASSWFSFPT